MSRPVAVVTGPSRGIGRATAILLGRRGLDVALLGRQSDALDATLREVEATGARARIAPCDVSDEASVAAAAARVVTEMAVPEIVVNNAGIVRRATIEETTARDFDDVLAVNLRGAFLVTRAFLPRMRERGRGRFVFVSSISATLGSPGNASYAASKWALTGFAKSLAEELRGSALLSLAVLPGSVDTDMLAGSGFAPAMTADDVAGTIAYLALEAPPAMNGSAVEVFG
ncbi:MAG TPA: SDR family oxidoreductase [Polyangiaceae bacterium]|nr:SDR family oxidoreductase [Polyangiaceae bacterium]